MTCHLVALAILLTLLINPLFALSEDQLVVVQAVSDSGRTFAIRKGAQDGFSIGQESLFATKSMNMRAQVVEINRFFTVWQLKEAAARVPFQKGDIITFTRSTENLWSYIPSQFKRKQINFEEINTWQVKSSYSYGLNESTSDVDADVVASRTGLQLEGSFAKQFSAQWEWLVGARYDRDIISLNAVGVDIVNNRYMLTADLHYYFDKAYLKKYRLYAGLGVGYGISNSTVEEAVSTGTALLLPTVKLGFINRMSIKYSLVGEASVEAISQTESFEGGSSQKTQINSTKITIGLRF